MPRKIDDEVRVVSFFRTAPLEVAESMLLVVKQLVLERKPKPAKKEKCPIVPEELGEC